MSIVSVIRALKQDLGMAHRSSVRLSTTLDGPTLWCSHWRLCVKQSACTKIHHALEPGY